MKKIAFVAKELQSGGTEVSLINLLNSINEKYDITLFLYKNRGIYTTDIPKNIKIIEIFDENTIKFTEKFDLKKNYIIENLKIIIVKIICKFSYQKYKKILEKYCKKNEESFDVCVDFHGYGYFGSDYALKYIKAKEKIMFIHDEKVDWISKNLNIVSKFDKYFCVSNSCKKIIEKKYNFCQNKTYICRNVLDIKKIKKLSTQKIKRDNNKLQILTIGRLEYQKGYDLLIDIAKKLHNNNVEFEWNIIGGGSLRNSIKNKITKNHLKDNVHLLGIIKNPYPYIKNCDIYIQTSRHEGYGIAIAEARILRKIVISTNLECVSEQIKHEYNGLLCEYDADDFYKNIMRLLTNDSLKNKLQHNLNKDICDNIDFELLMED